MTFEQESEGSEAIRGKDVPGRIEKDGQCNQGTVRPESGEVSKGKVPSYWLQSGRLGFCSRCSEEPLEDLDQGSGVVHVFNGSFLIYL